jgi:hypothetical protein
MVFSNDGGASWSRDLELDQLMTANGTFKYRNGAGPAFPGTHVDFFRGYVQPSFIAFDAEKGNVVAAGGQDSGVFLSTDGGTNWSLTTDPIGGSPHIPRPRLAYFDHEPPGKVSIYIGSQGRGIWRIAAPFRSSRKIVSRRCKLRPPRVPVVKELPCIGPTLR